MPGTVTVGCKIPTGMVLQLFRMEDHEEPVMAGGYRIVKRAMVDREPVKLNGPARYIGRDSAHTIISGSGITYNVDADFFAEWMKQNADHPAVKGKFIYAQSKPGEIEAQARDHRSLKTGLEGIDPNNLPEEFKRTIKTAEGFNNG